MTKDNIPRADTSLEKLAKLPPVFDHTSGKGTLTAGNSSPLTDGAAAIWLANDDGLKRVPSDTPHVKLLDWEMAAVDMERDGLADGARPGRCRACWRATTCAMTASRCGKSTKRSPRRCCVTSPLSRTRISCETRVGVTACDLGRFPWERYNPNGGSVAIGHPFGATGARILSQAVKELAKMPSGSLAVVSICTDGGLGVRHLAAGRVMEDEQHSTRRSRLCAWA